MYFKSSLYALLLISIATVEAAPVSGQGTWESSLLGRDLDGDTNTIEGYYDTVLNITWLADANLAASNKFVPELINVDGSMPWGVAYQWIDGMNADAGSGYLGYNGWRMPTVSPINGTSFNTTPSNDGSTDVGHANNTGWVDGSGNPVSELGHMFYINLGNYGFCEPTNNCGDLGTIITGHPWGLTNTGSFSNLVADFYWNPLGYSLDDAWSFGFFGGDQGLRDKQSYQYVWAVHDGDIGSPVPIPATFWLLSSGLIGLIAVARRKKA